MEGLSHFWQQSDTVGRAVALLLLAMSILSWVVILWKGWVLRRADPHRGRRRLRPHGPDADRRRG